MNKIEYFLKNHSPKILTVLGAGGVVATAILTAKATPKAMTLIELAEDEKGEDLTPLEIVKVAWKPYIPATITGISTIVCIFGINYLNAKTQASLVSAYALLDNSYREYRKKVDELYPEGDINVKQEIAKSKYDPNMEVVPEKLLFFDYQSMQYFYSTMDKVLQVEHVFLDNLVNRGYAMLNEYYELLGLPYQSYGYQLGWTNFESNDPYNCEELAFDYEKAVASNGQEYWIITTNIPPYIDYII